MKKLFACALIAMTLPAWAGEKEIRASLHEKFPQIEKIDHIQATPYGGLYEVVIGDQLLYSDADGKYLFDGSVIEASSRRDLTEERRRVLFAIDFDALPLDLAVKRVKGNGKRRMAYFTDPNCGYCKRLEKELAQIDNVTLYLFLYPIFQGSDEIVRDVYCAKDPIKTWDAWMLRSERPAKADCAVPTEKVLALGHKHRVSGTPNLIFGDGMQVPGYLPAAELEKRLNAPATKAKP